jgi:hypothetical protein
VITAGGGRFWGCLPRNQPLADFADIHGQVAAIYLDIKYLDVKIYAG